MNQAILFNIKKSIISLLFLLLPILALAHPLKPSTFDIVFKKDGTFEMQIKTNLEVFLAGIKPTHKDTDHAPQFLIYNKLRELSSDKLEKKAKEFEPNLRKAIKLTFDNQIAQLNFTRFEIPPAGDLKVARKSTVIYTGNIPKEAKNVVFDFSRKLGSSAVFLSNEGDKVKFSFWDTYSSKTPPFKLGEQVEAQPLFDIFTEYLVVGFEHIIPKGLDHILFVIGLFLLSQAWRPLLWQITAFTIAHSVTLALTILGYISLSASIIEPLIALSIIYIAVENIFTKTLHSWRVAVVFLFGLLHGMGFASVLTDIGLPEYSLTTALVSFNIGVEFGQIAVIALAFLLTFKLHNHKFFRSLFVIPVSLIISIIGLYWFIERVWG